MVLATSPIVAEQRVVLHNISWQLFEQMLTEMGDNRGTRLTYDRGTLELMTPLIPHEQNNRLVDKLVDILAEELGLNLKSTGSTTFKRRDLKRGTEPDTSFYIQNEPLMRSKETVDLTRDPPPDLVIEIEYSSPAINKLELYAAMGVPEFWRYNGLELRIYRLEDGEYVPCEDSPTFRPILTREIPRFLKRSLEIGEMPMKREFRAWVQQQLSQIV